jgi:predicted dehydrogenase
MGKKLLKTGKNFYLKEIKLRKNINIGLVGCGKIAEEHAKVILSFGHNVQCLVTRSISERSKKFVKRFKIKNHHTELKNTYDNIYNLHAWIVCTPWDKNTQILKELISKTNKAILVEKPIFLEDLGKFKNKNKIKTRNNIFIAYNRNFYDYVHYLISYLKTKKEFIIQANLSDQINKIIDKHGTKIKKYSLEYITSHWISFLYVLSKNIGHEIKSSNNYNIKNKSLIKSKSFNLDSKNKKIININYIPNCPKKLSIEIYSSKNLIRISPLERFTMVNELIKKQKNHQNIYEEKTLFDYQVNDSYKPGFRNQYHNFINFAVLNKGEKKLLIDLIDLKEINKIIKYFR